MESLPSNLAERQAEAHIEKLKVEHEILKQKLTPAHQRREFLKAISGVGAMLAGLAAVAALFFSVIRATNELNQQREFHIEERLESALIRIASDSVGERLSAIVSLKGFLEATDKVRQERSLISLAHMLAVEENATSRAAILEIFRGLNPAYISLGAVDTATETLVGLSRSLTLSGKLNRKNAAGKRYPPLSERDALARAVGQAIASLISFGTNVRDFSGIYCPNCDFVSQRLNGANFDRAVLIRADFSDAILTDASFDQADLEGTRFRKAKLQRAHLTQSESRHVVGALTMQYGTMQYGWSRLSDDLYPVGMPDFNCADLTGADFTGRVLFGLVRADAKLIHHYNFKPSSFRYAILDGTKLASIRVYGVNRKSADIALPFTTTSTASHGVHISRHGKEYWVFEADLGTTSQLSWTNESVNFRKSMDQLAWAFVGSNWKKALLPPALAEFLTHFDWGEREVPSQSGDRRSSRAT